ncbi:hypothetical protein FI667_g3873, partial [Globisporangium splendens]
MKVHDSKQDSKPNCLCDGGIWWTAQREQEREHQLHLKKQRLDELNDIGLSSLFALSQMALDALPPPSELATLLLKPLPFRLDVMNACMKIFAEAKSTSGIRSFDTDESFPPQTKGIDWNHQWKGEILDFQHDLYQLGELLEPLTRELPEDLETMKKELLASVDRGTTANDMLARFFQAIRASREGKMNPEMDEHGADAVATTRQSLKISSKRPQPILQRRLKGQISESRMLEVLDRQLRTSFNDDDPRHPRAVDSNQDEAKEELVCVSTMVAVEPTAATNEFDKPSRDENQVDHDRSSTATKTRSPSPEV